MPKTRNPFGFTLIELMVVIVIMAILSTVGMVLYSSAQATARDGKRRQDLEDLKKALYLLKTSSGGTFVGTGFFNGYAAVMNDANGMEKDVVGSLKNNLIVNGKVLKAAVHDPKCPVGVCATGSVDYCLNIRTDDVFYIHARLEKDPGAAASTEKGCNVAEAAPPNSCLSLYNYCISQ
jgi:prepilin-type N-terminal cleavage/methylation domain-containing protein